MNGADIEMQVITRLDMVSEPCFDLVDGGVGVSDAGNRAWSIADGIDGERDLGYDDARLAAAGASGQHHVLVGADRHPLLARQVHGAASHFAASTMYFGIVLAAST